MFLLVKQEETFVSWTGALRFMERLSKAAFFFLFLTVLKCDKHHHSEADRLMLFSRCKKT